MAKKYPLGVVLTVSTGVVLVRDIGLPNAMLDDMHATWHSAQEAILSQYPQLQEMDTSGINGSNWEEWLDKQIEKHGAELEIQPLR